MTRKILTVATGLGISALTANAGLSTFTHIAQDAAGTGSFTGDITGVGPVTLNDDTAVGDFWNGGDTFSYLHEANQRTGNFTATVRVVGQTGDAAGRWGKAGIVARASLDPQASNASAQVASGTGSQLLAPSAGDHSPVPIRLAGRQNGSGGEGGFEIGIVDAGTGVESVNNVFPEGAAVNATWLSLSYNADNNGFIAGYAPDNGGVPGPWSYSAEKTDVANDGDGWYVGIGYSAHNSMTVGGAQGQHGVTFDRFAVVPEPSTSLLSLLGLGAFLMRRRR
jgi:hypothetical protein